MRTRHLATVGLAALAGAGCLLAASGPAAAAEVRPRAVHQITHITCNEPEDGTGYDDPYILVDGTQVWRDGPLYEGGKDIVGVKVGDGQLITLMEADWPDADDTLGARRVNGPGTYSFTDDGADYVITVI